VTGSFRCRALRDEIERCLDHDGTVRDWASPELGKIRSKMRTLANRLKERLDNLVHSSEMQKVLQEPIITVRNGRYVVPVKASTAAGFPALSTTSRAAAPRCSWNRPLLWS
jgi:DNA mismatch repair protein MutS2